MIVCDASQEKYIVKKGKIWVVGNGKKIDFYFGRREQGLYFVITVPVITTNKGSSLKGSSQQNFLWKFAYYEIEAKPNMLIVTDFIQLSPTACGGAPFQKGAFLFQSPTIQLYQGNLLTTR